MGEILIESSLESDITSDSEFIVGVNWGKPRNGHPEGSVKNHIIDVLRNIDAIDGLSVRDRTRLRLIAIIHDTFKYKVDRSKPRYGDNHHGMIARRFAEKYIFDNVILDIIETHDDAYNAWQSGNRNGDWAKAERRATALMDRIGENMWLYLLFYASDNSTGDKSSEPYAWFNNLYYLWRNGREEQTHRGHI